MITVRAVRLLEQLQLLVIVASQSQLLHAIYLKYFDDIFIVFPSIKKLLFNML